MQSTDTIGKKTFRKQLRELFLLVVGLLKNKKSQTAIQQVGHVLSEDILLYRAKQRRRVTVALSVFLLALIAMPLQSITASERQSLSAITLYAKKYTTTIGTSGNQPVRVLKKKDQKGLQDSPAKYVSFLTPGEKPYNGYRIYVLPTDMPKEQVLSIKVYVNFKGEVKSNQTWSWSFYNWSTKKWVKIGDNKKSKANQWSALTFSVSNAQRFVNTSNQIHLQLKSNNSSGDAKIDYEAVVITYEKSPGKISTLVASKSPVRGQVTLGWTVPASSTWTTLPVSYEIRYSTEKILTENDWSNATPVADILPAPKNTGLTEKINVNNLQPGQLHYFVVRTRDVNNTLSPISNAVSETPFLPVEVSSIAELISAIEQANAGGVGGIIDLAEDYYTISSAYPTDPYNAFPAISVPIGIYGNDSTLERELNSANFRFFKVAKSGYLHLQGFTLKNGSALSDPFGTSNEYGGGAIFNDKGILSLRSCVIQDNLAIADLVQYNRWYQSSSGGAIYSTGGWIIVTECKFIGNKADADGGALFMESGELQLKQSEVKNNETGRYGIITAPSWFTPEVSLILIEDSVVSYNTGTNVVRGFDLVITGTEISHNNSIDITPSIWAGQTLVFKEGILHNNKGGVIVQNPINSIIENSCISGNIPSKHLDRTPPSNLYVVDASYIPENKLNAKNNYWGEPDGPSGSGEGHGDMAGVNVDFLPFAIEPPISNCPTEPIVSGVSVSSNLLKYPHDWSYLYMAPNSQVLLTGYIHGANGINRNSIWSIEEGGGSLSSEEGQANIFTAPSTYQYVKIRAKSFEQPDIFQDILIRIAKVEMKFFTRALTILKNSNVPLRASVIVDNSSFVSYDQHINWEIVSGNGTVVPWMFYSPSNTGTSIVRLSAVADPSQFIDIPITIVDSGPVHCSNYAFPQGPMSASVSNSANYNDPIFGRIDWSEYDPLVGTPQAISIAVASKGRTNEPPTIPIGSVFVTVKTDNQQKTYPMELVSGDYFNGTWSITINTEDTHCSIYAMDFRAVNAQSEKTVQVQMK